MRLKWCKFFVYFELFDKFCDVCWEKLLISNWLVVVLIVDGFVYYYGW